MYLAATVPRIIALITRTIFIHCHSLPFMPDAAADHEVQTIKTRSGYLVVPDAIVNTNWVQQIKMG